jgi:4-hydroxy-tetrahydrodipicolinate reductase
MLRVIQMGLGPIGRQMVRSAAQREGIRVVAAVDPADGIAGLDLAEVAEVPPEQRASIGAAGGAVAGHVRVSATLAEALAEAAAVAAVGGDVTADEGSQAAAAATPTAVAPGDGDDATVADVAIVTTFSDIDRVADQIAELAAARLPAVSTCEELSYPWATHTDTAARIDAVCREHGVACLGTGVNPGFLMDYLPAVLTGLCRRVRGVTVRRVQDAARRRVPFQQKIGAGLSPAEFERSVAAGSLRHVGLPESVHMLAAACGWELDRVEETIAPVIAESVVDGGYRPIAPGEAAGVEQWARGFCSPDAGAGPVVTLHFRAAVGEADPRDEIEIDGEPPIRSVIPAGVDGDLTTCAVVLNAAAVVAAASPGLHTMLDLPVPAVGR